LVCRLRPEAGGRTRKRWWTDVTRPYRTPENSDQKIEMPYIM